MKQTTLKSNQDFFNDWINEFKKMDLKKIYLNI